MPVATISGWLSTGDLSEIGYEADGTWRTARQDESQAHTVTTASTMNDIHSFRMEIVVVNGVSE